MAETHIVLEEAFGEQTLRQAKTFELFNNLEMTGNPCKMTDI